MGKADPSTFSVEEKYQIIEAYIHQGGAAGLQIEMEDEDDDEMDEATIEQMSAADTQTIEEQVNALYERDPVLKSVLGADPKTLSLYQKYQVMMQYQRAGDGNNSST